MKVLLKLLNNSSSLIGNLAVGADALELLESFGDEELARRNDIIS